MKSTTELINDLNDLNLSTEVRRDAARNIHFKKSFNAISPLIKALEAEDDLVVYKAIINALEAICHHWSDIEDGGPDVAEGELDLNDPAQAKLQGLRDLVFNARLVAAKHRAIFDILDARTSLIDEEAVDALWGDRRAVPYLLDMLKNDRLWDDLAETIICSLFRISNDERPNSIQVRCPISSYGANLRQDIAGLSEVPGHGTLRFILEVLGLSAPDLGNKSPEMESVHKLALSVLERFSNLEEIDLSSEDEEFFDCKPDYIYLKTFTKLRTLRCSYATDYDLRVLRHFPQLEALELVECQITDEGISLIRHSPHLKKLVIDDGGMTGLPGCEISNMGFRPIGTLAQLEYLSTVGVDGVDDSSLEALDQLTNLKSLELYGTRVTDAGVESLLKMKRLEYLGLDRTAISEEAVARIRVVLPECTISEPDYDE